MAPSEGFICHCVIAQFQSSSQHAEIKPRQAPRGRLTARPFDCHSDSPELQESWPRSVCCPARHNGPQRAALEKHVRVWLPGFGFQVPPYCQPSPQQCSSSWPPMTRCMGSGSMGFPLAPAFPGLTGEPLILAASAGGAA